MPFEDNIDLVGESRGNKWEVRHVETVIGRSRLLLN